MSGSFQNFTPALLSAKLPACYQLPSGKQPLPPVKQTRVTYSQNSLLVASSLLLASKLSDKLSRQIKKILTKTVNLTRYGQKQAQS